MAAAKNIQLEKPEKAVLEMLLLQKNNCSHEPVDITIVL